VKRPTISPRGARATRARCAAGLAVVVAAALAFAAPPASAGLTHNFLSSFHGADAPGGPLGAVLGGDAIDQSNGDVYVQEGIFQSSAHGLIDKFTAAGAYAGVQISGAETPQGSFAFGTNGIGDAVDNSSGADKGDLYVADPGHGVVDRFSESGAFQCQITGKVPATPEEEAHECNGSAGSATPQGSFSRLGGLAVDPATGNLYVAEPGNDVIDEFAPSGAYIGQVATSVFVQGIALDSHGNLYAAGNGRVEEFNAAGQFVSDLVSEALGISAVAVDPATDHVYVGEGAGVGNVQIAEYGPAGTEPQQLLDVFGRGRFESQYKLTALAVDGPTGKVYAGQLANFGAAGSPVDVFGPAVEVPDVTTGQPTSVQQTSATLNGSVNPEGLGVEECSFEYGTEIGAYDHTAACEHPGAAELPPDYSAHPVHADVSGLTPSTTYYYRLSAKNENGTVDSTAADSTAYQTFITPGPPAIDGESSVAIETTATLNAKIDPFGLETDCHLQYVDEEAFQSSGYAVATTVPCAPESLGHGFGDQGASVALAGLRPATTYHYRFLAANSAAPGGVAGPDRTFATFGIASFSFQALDEGGHPYTQAGGHPYQWSDNFTFNTTTGPDPGRTPAADANPKDIRTELPPGLIGNPTATPRCDNFNVAHADCPGSTQVGLLTITTAGGFSTESPLYNLVPPTGIAAQLGGRFNGFVTAHIDARVRSGADYGITSDALELSAAEGVIAVSVALWGVPADPSHDAQRYCPKPGEINEDPPCSANDPNPRPFLTNPTSCSGPLTTTMRVDSWVEPGEFVAAASEIPPITGCDRLDFGPTIKLTPESSAADTPTGLHVDLRLPQSENPLGLATADLKDAVVTLPRGVTVNPASANGLQACSPAQIGLTGAPGATPVTYTPEPANCPDAAKIGTVEVDSPLLDHPLPGAVYVAAQGDNPFNSLLAIYVAVDDPQSGVVVKLAGHVEPNPETGQLQTTFSENPQLPFEDFKLDFFGGPRAALRTPPTCGKYTTATNLSPWSSPEGEDAHPPSSFDIAAGPDGSRCASTEAEEPNRPSFEAGTLTPIAGAYSPFVLRLSRADGSQNLKGLDLTLPPGLIGRLAGVGECPESALAAAAARSGAEERQSPSCPPSTEVGRVTVGVGAGSSPYYVTGHAYLAGPYRGAPLSLAIVTSAVAGPFDLGTVVVRVGLYVNPETAQITARSDPIPTILDGIPLDVRDIRVNMDRNQFTLNPTSCEPMAVSGSALSVLNQIAPLSDGFQVGACNALGFKPSLNLKVSGGTHRGSHPSLRAVLRMPRGDANIARAAVSLPHSEFLDNAHIGTVCTRVQFGEGTTPGEKCPSASVYGHARAITPLLDKPLEGPVYLRSSSHELPDLVAALNGQIQVVLDGTIDSVHGGIRSRFEVVPDAPVSKFTLSMQGGSKGLLQNSEDLCAKPQRAVARFSAQNGKIEDFNPVLQAKCGGHHKKGKRH
jgi:hypothetical protein